MPEGQRVTADRIVVDAGVVAGKPVVRGMRVPVELVLQYLARQLDFTELFADYPRLARDDVRARLLFAAEAVRREAGGGR